MSLFSSAYSLGLDIGSSALKLVELKETKGGYVVTRCDFQEIPPDSIVDGQIINYQSVSAALEELLKRAKPHTKRVTTSIAGTSVIVKTVNLPMMTQDELEQSITWEAEQYLTVDINEVNLDFQILETRPEENQMSVLLVAAKKDIINDYVSVLSELKYQLVVMDVDCFAVQNIFEFNYPTEPGEMVVLVNIGSHITNVELYREGKPVITRDISIGGNSITDEMQKVLGFSYEEAEEVKKKVSEGEETSDQILGVMKAGVDNLVGEIQRTVDFLMGSVGESDIARIVISGGASKTYGLREELSNAYGKEVEVLDPFKSFQLDTKVVDPALINFLGSAATVAAGLALRRGE